MNVFDTLKTVFFGSKIPGSRRLVRIDGHTRRALVSALAIRADARFAATDTGVRSGAGFFPRAQ